MRLKKEIRQALASMNSVEKTCGLFHCPLEAARQLMPNIPWDGAPIRPGVIYIADVKIHKLMPGQWPCIPNWHCDFVPRDEETLIERPNLIKNDVPPMIFWISGSPITEFRDGRKVTPNTWIEFSQRDEHRGVAATEHCWRVFVRLTPIELMIAGLPNEQIPAQPEQWIRRHAQVYLDAANYRW